MTVPDVRRSSTIVFKGHIIIQQNMREQGFKLIDGEETARACMSPISKDNIVRTKRYHLVFSVTIDVAISHISKSKPVKCTGVTIVSLVMMHCEVGDGDGMSLGNDCSI